MKPLTIEDVYRLGFEEMPHYTVMDSKFLDIGRNRELSIGNLASPNEMLFISETHFDDPKKKENIVVLHNYDYDGYLTFEKLKGIVDLLMCTRLKNSNK